MATILAVDCSMSMSKKISKDGPSITKLDSAKECSELILRQLFRQKHAQISLVKFSSEAVCLQKFQPAEDVNKYFNCVKMIEMEDLCELGKLFSWVNNEVTEEWGNLQPVRVVVMTTARVSSSLAALKQSILDDTSKQIFDFPCQLDLLCYTEEGDQLKEFQKTIADIMANSNCTINTIPLLSKDSQFKLQQANIIESIEKYHKDHLRVTNSKFSLGSLFCEVQLFPTPNLPGRPSSLIKEIKIGGFLKITDVGFPPVFSKHLVIPVQRPDIRQSDEILLFLLTNNLAPQKLPSNQAGYHGGKVALLSLSDQNDAECYGLLHCQPVVADKPENGHNLFISTLSEDIAWLGKLDNLGYKHQFEKWEDKTFENNLNNNIVPDFPVNKDKYKASYVPQNFTSWSRPNTMQLDLSKFQRLGKKLPEKAQAFYKELNRIRRASISYGCRDLVQTLIQLLQHDIKQLPVNSNCMPHLEHVIKQLEASNNYGFDFIIEPMPDKKPDGKRRRMGD